MKLRNKKSGEIMNFRWYHSLAEINEDWEVYKPKEPLIKDEKVRKAVRAWAEALDTDSCSFRADHDIFDFIAIGANCLRFDMSDGFDTYKLKDIESGYYHIAELCGEEE